MQCKSDHLICGSCYQDKNEKCGKCGGPISDKGCKLLEEMLDAIHVHCTYKKDGCDNERLKLTEKRAHEYYCSHRP